MRDRLAFGESLPARSLQLYFRNGSLQEYVCNNMFSRDERWGELGYEYFMLSSTSFATPRSLFGSSSR